MIELGYVSGFHGIRGELKIHSYTTPRQNILNYSPWYLAVADNWLEFELAGSKTTNKSVIAYLSGVDNREDASAYLGSKIAIKPQQLDVLPPGEYYWFELIGLAVYNKHNQHLGQISEIITTGAHDVLIVTAANRRTLIPYTWDVHVLNVNLVENKMLVDWDIF